MARNDRETVDVSDDAVAAGRVTAGVPAGATVIDPPPALGPRDALVDPRPGDIIPELDTKGYHVGIVPQPAAPVSVDGVTVAGFQSDGSHESRFRSFRDLKARKDPADLGVAPSPDPRPSVAMVPGVGMVDTSALMGPGPKPEK
jgi:hypothetical protein